MCLVASVATDVSEALKVGEARAVMLKDAPPHIFQSCLAVYCWGGADGVGVKREANSNDGNSNTEVGLELELP